MFIAISHHTCKPGQMEIAKERMDKNTAELAAEPGFVQRYRMSDEKRPNVLSALTIWNSREDYENNRKKRFGGPQDLSKTPYEKIEAETYEVGARVEPASKTAQES